MTSLPLALRQPVTQGVNQIVMRELVVASWACRDCIGRVICGGDFGGSDQPEICIEDFNQALILLRLILIAGDVQQFGPVASCL